MEKLSFVIPCYCSQSTIGNIVSRIIKTVEEDGRYDYEIICVNDCSKDDTWAILKKIACGNEKIKAINLSTNYGQHAALMAGFHYVEGDVIVCLDDDGENPPEQMFKLINKLEEGYDLVSVKYVSDNRGFIRSIGTKISLFMAQHLIGKPKNVDINSYSVFRKFIIQYLLKYENPYPFVFGQILQVTKNVANVQIERGKRESGVSGYNISKLLSLWMNGFTAFSEKPLVIAGYFGVISAIFGFVLAIITIIKRIFNPRMSAGYASLMACVLFMGGVILVFCGLLGEYIGRIYISINRVPQYAIKETVNLKKT